MKYVCKTSIHFSVYKDLHYHGRKLLIGFVNWIVFWRHAIRKAESLSWYFVIFLREKSAYQIKQYVYAYLERLIFRVTYF